MLFVGKLMAALNDVATNHKKIRPQHATVLSFCPELYWWSPHDLTDSTFSKRQFYTILTSECRGLVTLA